MAQYDIDALLERLRALSDPEYAAFNARLVPCDVASTLGVRTPALRSIAREIQRNEDWRAFLDASRAHPLHDLRMLHAFVLGGARCWIDEKLAGIEAFLPCMDNWEVCDGLCSSFKPRANEQEAAFAYCLACADAEEEFRKRFGLVMLMSRFADPPFAEGTLRAYRRFRHDGYYARMGATWGLATLWLHQRDGALAILREGLWDDFTHNKAIQKLCESYRVSDEDKALARSLRRGRAKRT